MKLGKKCTPGHDEWSYVWFIEKDGTNVRQEDYNLPLEIGEKEESQPSTDKSTVPRY